MTRPGELDGDRHGLAMALDGVAAGYQGSTIVRGVSLSLGVGEILGVVGRNGAGKTTLIKTIMGLIPAVAGRIHLHGMEITRQSAVQRARAGLGYVPQGRGIFTRLTVSENLQMGALVGTGGAGGLDAVYGFFPILRKRQNQKAGTLSGGEQQMLAIGRVLAGAPRLLILDEPSEGVQPSVVDEIADVIRERNRAGLPVIIVEQNIDMLEELAHRCIVLEKGAIAAELTPAELSQPDVARRYLAI
jgi:ABC-type branched-subunit amino acid transport system ATPase component